jgi:hypothetical protein
MIKKPYTLIEKFMLSIKNILCRHPRIMYYIKGQLYIPFIITVMFIFPRQDNNDIWLIMIISQFITSYLFWDLDLKIFTSHNSKDRECLQT